MSARLVGADFDRADHAMQKVVPIQQVPHAPPHFLRGAGFPSLDRIWQRF